MAQMTALRRRMIDDMTVRNLSPATQQSYVYAVRSTRSRHRRSSRQNHLRFSGSLGFRLSPAGANPLRVRINSRVRLRLRWTPIVRQPEPGLKV